MWRGFGFAIAHKIAPLAYRREGYFCFAKVQIFHAVHTLRLLSSSHSCNVSE
jgi:hypothetical protein